MMDSGTMLDADISSELIENIFYPNTPPARRGDDPA